MPNTRIQSLLMKMADELEREVAKAVRRTFLESELAQYLRAQEPPTEAVPAVEEQTPVAKTCTMPGCDQPVHSRGMCRRHYFDWVGEEWKRTRPNGRKGGRARNQSQPAVTTDANVGVREPEIEAGPTVGCSEPGCERKVHARGLCKRHFMVWVQKQRYAKKKGEPAGSELKVIAPDPTVVPEPSTPNSDSSAIKAYIKPAIRVIEATTAVDETAPAEVIPIPRILVSVEESIADVVPLFPATSGERATADEGSAPVDFVGEPELPEETQSIDATAPEVPMLAIKDQSRCKEPGCQKVIHANALCHQHYYAWVARQFEAKWGGGGESAADQGKKPEDAAPMNVASAEGDTSPVSLTTTAATPTPASCSHPDCSEKVHAKGMCSRHFMEWVRTKKGAAQRSPDKKERANRVVPNCSHAGCDRPAFRKGMCGAHFMEWVRSASGGARKAEEASKAEPQIESQNENGGSPTIVKPEALDRVPYAAESQDLSIQVERIKTCAFPGCGRKVRHQRFCAKHRKISIDGAPRSEEHDEAEAREPSESAAAEVASATTVLRRSKGDAPVGAADDELAHCTHPDCDRKVFSRGLCAQHFMEERNRSRKGLGPIDRTA